MDANERESNVSFCVPDDVHVSLNIPEFEHGNVRA